MNEHHIHRKRRATMLVLASWELFAVATMLLWGRSTFAAEVQRQRTMGTSQALALRVLLLRVAAVSPVVWRLFASRRAPVG